MGSYNDEDPAPTCKSLATTQLHELSQVSMATKECQISPTHAICKYAGKGRSYTSEEVEKGVPLPDLICHVGQFKYVRALTRREAASVESWSWTYIVCTRC